MHGSRFAVSRKSGGPFHAVSWICVSVLGVLPANISMHLLRRSGALPQLPMAKLFARDLGWISALTIVSDVRFSETGTAKPVDSLCTGNSTLGARGYH